MRFPMKYLNVLELLSYPVQANLIERNPCNKDEIAVYISEIKNRPDGFYWQNIHTAAQDLLKKPKDQEMIYSEILKTKIEMNFTEILDY